MFKKIPVELLSASVAEGHVFPFHTSGASGAYGIGIVMVIENYFCDRKRGSVGDGFRKQADGMAVFLLRG